MESGENGTIQFTPGTSLERININFSDPNAEVDGQRSHKDTPHPFLTDLAVRQAMALAVDRETISTQFYGDGEPATANVVNGLPDIRLPEHLASSSTSTRPRRRWRRPAGCMDGDVRTKDGVELKITYSTSINPVRQKTQAVNKQNFEEIGFQVSLQQVDSGIFFDGSPGNEQNTGHLYVDINMYTNGPGTPVPVDYHVWLVRRAGRLQHLPGSPTTGTARTTSATTTPEYDALYDQLRAHGRRRAGGPDHHPDERHPRQRRRHDPGGEPGGRQVRDLQPAHNDNVALSALEGDFWNIANWNTVE